MLQEGCKFALICAAKKGAMRDEAEKETIVVLELTA